MGTQSNRERGGRRGVTRYVEASLLLLLAEQRAHGWELSERLPTVFPVPGRLPDISTVYRTLADLEAQGAVRSQFTPGEGGGRKVYELTEVGWDLLAFWEAQFNEERTGLVALLRHFGRVRKRRSRPHAGA